MMFADPRRVHADLFGVQRFGGDVGDELVRGARIVFVVIVAQREIAEIHHILPRLWHQSTANPCRKHLSERSRSAGQVN
jgi:hypothetical protein